ncbi:MAG: putative Type pilus assembly PilZ [Frankiales bacterium]|nr:putative Type pilus assembly PilZ [Frankiales bacterium]
MTSVPGVDHPEEQSEADVTLTGRGISVSSRVEFVNDGVIVVRPSVGDYVQQIVVAVGNEVEVFWKGPEDQRMVPARVASVEQGAVVRWRLEMTGEAEVSQRRKAVRARVTVPIEAGYGSVEMTGETVDLSENGMRATLDGFGVPPEPGSMMDVVIKLDDGEVTMKAQVIRQQARGARWLMSIRFIDIEERDGDRLRRRVFQALREERARATD